MSEALTAMQRPNEIIASLRDITVTYDGYRTRSLSHVSVDFRRGEVTGVLGAKGAGKSTLLKILAGRLTSAEGAAKIFGRSPRGSARARVGYLPGKIDPSHRPGFLARLFAPKEKSIATARGSSRLTQAILGNRDLLVLDDPFDDLAAAEISEAKALVREMTARGKTIVLSSSALMEVKELCQRFVILHEGKIQAIGTLEELLSGGGAIRFLPAVLPQELVERVLKTLREEIVNARIPSAQVTPSEKIQPAATPSPDEVLAALTKSKPGH